MIKYNEASQIIIEDESKWTQTQEGDWKLFFNTNKKFDDEKQTKKAISSSVKFNTNSTMNKLKLGCKVMTPLGIGTLLKMEEKEAMVKFIKEEKTVSFQPSVVCYEFPINLKIASNEFGSWYRLYVPANGDVAMLRKLIDKLQIIDTVNCDYTLINKAMDLRDSSTFEQLQIKSDEKFLLCGMKKIEQKLSRFDKIADYWYCNPDSIVFSVSRKIKLTAIGIYSSMDGLIQNGNIKVSEVEGDARGRRNRRGRSRSLATTDHGAGNYRETLIFEQPATVQVAIDRTNPITRVDLDKPVTIKPHQDYKVEFSCSNPSEVFFGTGGKATALGDKNVEFYFKQSMHSSSQVQGNFPDFYYFC